MNVLRPSSSFATANRPGVIFATHTDSTSKTGKLESGAFWKTTSLQNSTTTPEGGGYDQGSQVGVYDQFVVVTTSDGISHVHPHGFYSGLSIKKD